MERLLLLIGLGVALTLLVLAARRWAQRRVRLVAATPAQDLWGLLQLEPDGRPAVLAFSTASCAECLVQARILDRVSAEGIRVLRVDAAQRPDVAGAFGVITVPSTVVMDDGGAVVAVNHGLTDAQRIRSQLAVSVRETG